MTQFARWYYVGSFIIVLVFFVGAGLVWRSFSSAAVLPGDVNNVVGWAWTGNTGWVSLNYKNCVDLNAIAIPPNPGPCDIATPPVEYGLRLTVNNEGTGGVMTGYAWSENLGWICFGDGQGDASKGCVDAPPDAPALSITFTCKDNLGVTATCDEAYGDAAFINGWAKIVSLGDAGWIKLSEDYPTKVVFGETSTSSKLDGYMWHYAGGSALASAYGVGWIRFAEGQEVLFPYLRAEGGDVFSKGNIRSFFPAPENIGNAQFLIHVQGTSITRFKSSLEIDPAAAALCSAGSVCRELGYSLITNTIDSAREEDEPYNFKLGRFDFKGLRTVTNISTGENKYGDAVVIGAPDFSLPLNDAVYFIDNDYTISSATIVSNGNATKGGAGTVVIRGNLNINNDISYSADSVASRERLASVAWIVLGDVNIARSVTKVVGSFIVYGKLGAAAGNVCDGGLEPDNTLCSVPGSSCVSGGTCKHICLAKQSNGELYNGCGKFVTGDPDPALDNSQKRLEVSGTVFARQFILLRSYVNVITREAAEKFIADGRIQLNSPPGLSDFAKGLPIFRR